MEKIALVTGGCGYIGTCLVRQLIAREYKVIAFDLRIPERFTHEFGETVTAVSGDLLSEDLADTINTYKPTHVFHLAGLKNRTNCQEEFKTSIDVNYKGALNLFCALLGKDWIQHVVSIGTSEEYGGAQPPFNEETREIPNSAYGLSKLSATRLALLYHSQYGFPVTILRPSIAYGPNQGVEMFLPALINTLRSGVEFKMTEGNQLRDFIYIDDLVDAIIMSAESKRTIGEILNIAYGKSERLADVAMYLAKLLGKEHLLKLGAIPYRKFEIMNYSVSAVKAKTILDWEPRVSIYDGVKKLI